MAKQTEKETEQTNTKPGDRHIKIYKFGSAPQLAYQKGGLLHGAHLDGDYTSARALALFAALGLDAETSEEDSLVTLPDGRLALVGQESTGCTFALETAPFYGVIDRRWTGRSKMIAGTEWPIEHTLSRATWGWAVTQDLCNGQWFKQTDFRGRNAMQQARALFASLASPPPVVDRDLPPLAR